VLQSLSEPPADVALHVMIDQVAKDIIAAEKLRVLERREATRGIAERNVRVPLR
jgi:hypothetical protein